MLLPISVIIDIARLAFNHESYGFLIFIEIVMFLAKFAGLFFGYKVCKFWESGEGAPYEGAIVGGAPPTPSYGARLQQRLRLLRAGSG